MIGIPVLLDQRLLFPDKFLDPTVCHMVSSCQSKHIDVCLRLHDIILVNVINMHIHQAIPVFINNLCMTVACSNIYRDAGQNSGRFTVFAFVFESMDVRSSICIIPDFPYS